MYKTKPLDPLLHKSIHIFQLSSVCVCRVRVLPLTKRLVDDQKVTLSRVLVRGTRLVQF